MRNIVYSALFVSGLAVVFAFGFKVKAKQPKYIDKANMDLSVKPGDNFYLYVNGGWIKDNPVPGIKTRWGSFDVLREESSRRMKELLSDAAANTSVSPARQKIGDFFTSGMDSLSREKLGYQPIKAQLQQIDSITTIPGLLQTIAVNRTQGVDGPFGFSIQPDRKQVTMYVPAISQGGTSLPDRDYYLSSNQRSVTIRKAFQQHVANVFKLVGDDEAMANSKAGAIMRIETALAKAQYSRVEMRDPYKTYNKFAINDLSATTPSIDWKAMFATMKLTGADSVIVSNPVFFKTLDILLSALPLEDWKTYLAWHFLNGATGYLSTAFVNENFSFNKVLSGQQEQTPRWQTISATIDGSLGDLLGALYVEKYFKPEAKQRMLDLVNNLQVTLGARIRGLDWMSDDTKTKALEKLNAFSKKIAYPDKWRDYKDLVIAKDDFFGNARRVSEWSYDEMIGRYGKPVDKTLWGMTPPTINAYYSPSYNEILFPAGILQSPFFDFGADDAINYGGIGAVIGHEMTHGFDDQGSQYAADGNLKNWWGKEDSEKFKTRTGLVVDQYNAFTVLDSIHLNGKLTLGENLADLGGLNVAYEAFTHTKQFKEGKKIDGLTPTQRFFINWAQVWRSNTRPETAAQLVLTDPHSPGMHRANGPVVNMDSWYEAFNVQQGDKMYVAPDMRIKIW